MRRYAVLFAALLTTLPSGCASLRSIHDSGDKPSEAGLVYRLPLRNLTLTLSNNDQGSAPEISVTASSAYPDMTHRFVLKFATNLVGNNELDVAVDERGLLTSASSKTTAQVGDVFANIAEDFGVGIASASTTCSRKGTYVRQVIVPAPIGTGALKKKDAPFKANDFGWYQLPAVEIYDQCKVTLGMKPLDGIGTEADRVFVGKHDKSGSGVFYRGNRAFIVRAGIDGAEKDFLVMMPDLRTTEYLPIKRTLFADNEAKITFVDGSLRTYKQTAGGELVGLTALPARVIKAYVSAVADSFKRRSASVKEEAAYLAQINALILQQQATERCLAAEQSGDAAAIAAACK